MDEFDLEKQAGGSLAAAFAPVKARALVVALEGDWLFLPRQSEALAGGLLAAGKDVSAFRLDAPSGHDSFLIHIRELTAVLEASSCANRRALRPRSTPTTAATTMTLWRLMPAGRPHGARRGVRRRHAPQLPRRAPPGAGRHRDRHRRRERPRVARGGHNVMLADADAGLSAVPDDAFDCAILSESLQVMRRPDRVLEELLRVAPVGDRLLPRTSGCGRSRRSWSSAGGCRSRSACPGSGTTRRTSTCAR